MRFISPNPMWSLVVCSAVALLAAGGCARAPVSSGSGVRLIITMRFAGPINDSYQYFALIRNGADSTGQNGPIPVVQPPYLNGFATGQNTATAAFTDFVEYSRVQRQPTSTRYGVYHLLGGIGGDPNRNIFSARGEPDVTTSPAGGSTLRFEVDLSRLQPDASDPDPNNGSRPRYLQINLLATTTTPIDPVNVDPAKYVDALGDQRSGSGSFNTFLTIDTQQTGRIWSNSPNAGDPTYEPTGDAFPGDKDPAVDMIAWSIQVSAN